MMSTVKNSSSPSDRSRVLSLGYMDLTSEEVAGIIGVSCCSATAVQWRFGVKTNGKEFRFKLVLWMLHSIASCKVPGTNMICSLKPLIGSLWFWGPGCNAWEWFYGVVHKWVYFAVQILHSSGVIFLSSFYFPTIIGQVGMIEFVSYEVICATSVKSHWIGLGGKISIFKQTLTAGAQHW